MNCATCGKLSSDDYYTCSHNFLGFGFKVKGKRDSVQEEKGN
jgi:hypothetical protein